MGWAQHYIDQLKRGQTVKFRPRGNSMQPRIKSGALCTVEPITETTTLSEGDVVLCKVSGKEYLHLVKAIASTGLYQIGNNRGGINGWIGLKNIYGRLVKVEP